MAALVPALSDYFKAKGYSISQLNAGYCLPLVQHFPLNYSHVATNRCAEINRFVVQQIKKNNYSAVILSSYFYEYAFKGDPEASYPSYMADLGHEISQIKKDATNFIVVGPVPIWEPSLVQLLNKELIAGKVPDAKSNYGLDMDSIMADSKMKDFAIKLDVKYVSLIDHLCSAEGCLRITPPEFGTVAIAHDYGHFSKGGAEFVVQKFLGKELERHILPIQ